MLPYIAADVVDISPAARTVTGGDAALPEQKLERGRPLTDPPPKNTKVWYGLPMVLTDSGAIVLSVVLPIAFATDGANQHPEIPYFVALGGATYVAGGPIVHLVRGHPWVAVGSLTIRLLGPFATAGLGMVVLPAIGSCHSNDDSLLSCSQAAQIVGGVLGFIGGVATAMVVDDFVLARDEQPTPMETKKSASFTWQPNVNFVREGNSRAPVLGVAGTF